MTRATADDDIDSIDQGGRWRRRRAIKNDRGDRVITTHSRKETTEATEEREGLNYHELYRVETSYNKR